MSMPVVRQWLCNNQLCPRHRSLDESARMALVGTAIVEGLAKLLMHNNSRSHAPHSGVEEADIIKVNVLLIHGRSQVHCPDDIVQQASVVRKEGVYQLTLCSAISNLHYSSSVEADSIPTWKCSSLSALLPKLHELGEGMNSDEGEFLSLATSSQCSCHCTQLTSATRINWSASICSLRCQQTC